MQATIRAVAAALLTMTLVPVVVAPTAGAAGDNDQFLLFDEDLTHTPSSYAQASDIGGPSDWENPIDYAHGRVYARVDVTDKPSTKKLSMQLCMWRDSFDQETCSNQKVFRTEGVYFFDLGKPSQWWKLNGVWDFDRAFSPARIMIKDPGRKELLMTTKCGAACYTGPLDLADHTPIELSATVVVVPKGEKLDPPGGWLGCPRGWSPLCVNKAPVVDAGDHIATQAPSDSVALAATATDDTLLDPTAGLSTEWSVVSGPGAVTISDPGTLNPTATFERTGAYRLLLTVSDGIKTVTDEIGVSVRPATGGGSAKLIASKAPVPVKNDRAIVTWLEDLGLTVEVLDDHKVTKDQLDGADVVVISSTVIPGRIQNWIADVDAPIVSSEVMIAPKLGFGTKGRQFGGQRLVRIVDPSSPLAAGIAGDVVVSKPGGIGGVSGVGAEVRVVAATVKKNTDVATIVQVEEGAMLSTGEASARRVGFFAGADLPPKTFIEGRALFDAAVAWAVTEPVPPPPAPWWNTNWAFRETIEMSTGSHARVDQVVEADIDLTSTLAEAEVSLAVESLRVVEIDSDGTVVDAAVPFQFDAVPDFDGATNAAGRLTVLAAGTTSAGQRRTFNLYFDSPSSGHPGVSFSPMVPVADGVHDEGQNSFEVTLGESTWLYQKAAGGFSSLIDDDGNDWISYSTAEGSAGEFRGLPNAVFPEGHFHPGATTSTTTLVSSGPLRAVIQSVTNDGQWKAQWEFFPTFARMTMLDAADDYWLLYEGTPGGAVDSADKVLRSTGAVNGISKKWAGDLPGNEWVAFSDAGADRALYLAHLTDDTAVDSYRLMNGEMTVFGFGRRRVADFLVGSHELVVGFVESADKATVQSGAKAASAPVVVSLEGQQVRPSP